MYSKKCSKKKILRVTMVFLILLTFVPIMTLARGNTSLNDNKGLGSIFSDISLNQALAQAKNNNKLVFIDCYTSWCGPCKVMANTVFKDSVTGDFMNARFVSIKLNMEEEGDGQFVYSKFKIISFPTYLVLKTDGTIMGKFEGSCSAADLKKRIMYILESNEKSL